MRFARTLDPRSAVLIGIDVNDPRRAALRFMHVFGVRYSVVADPSRTIADRYRIIGLPTTFVIDREGRIAWRLLGPRTVASLDRALVEVEG